jgi:UDPglucose 6-dehydrogenase
MLKTGRLNFTDSFRQGLNGVDLAYVSIDTPVGEDDEPDLSPIWKVVDEVGLAAKDGLIVVVTAQVPIGTCAQIAARLGSRLEVAYVPEFLRLGTALDTFQNADRFVIGADDPKLAKRLFEIYQPLRRPIRVTDVRSAEMAKHASNAWLATSISFINQIADLCEQVGADVTEVADVMKLDRRVGHHAFLSAGVGYAGGTLGREIHALQRLGASYNVSTELFDAVDHVNQRRMRHILGRVRSIQPVLDNVPIAVFGLTYKAGTSTLRRSASLTLIDELTAKGANVAVYDPLAQLDEGGHLPRFTLHRVPAEAVRHAHALILMARWPEDLTPNEVAKLMARAVLVDTGNYLDPDAARAAGLEYHGIGR